MSLDGIFLSKIKEEIEKEALYSRIDKISQPSKDEIVLSLRGRNIAKKLLLCTRTNCPRIHFITLPMQNPQKPPMFCMLLRKYLLNAQLKDIRQYGYDRILFLDFNATNEIGDKTELTLCLEIMGTYSNIILIGENGKIIDSLRRIDFVSSSTRQILPNLDYVLPEKQNKCNLSENSINEIVSMIKMNERIKLSKSILSSIQGISPVVSREISFRVCDDDKYIFNLNNEETHSLFNEIEKLKNSALFENVSYIIENKNGEKIEFSFFEILQYGNGANLQKYNSFSKLLEEYYFDKDRIDRNKQSGQDMFKLVSNLTERITKKINLQKNDYKKCENKDEFRLKAELINANIYRLQKGSLFYDLENYYDNNNLLRISADPMLTPEQNAQKYYKQYRKSQTAEKMLVGLIEKSENELLYLHSVHDELIRAENETELSAIKEELISSGYIKKNKTKNQKSPKALEPIKLKTSDGFRVFVGRNNIQNDKLSMKQANNHDMFFHVSKATGSHVILVSDNKEFTKTALTEAGIIASYYSSQQLSSVVCVDYTLVKNLKKPVGAKPGLVIYHEYNTMNVKPDFEIVKKLLYI